MSTSQCTRCFWNFALFVFVFLCFRIKRHTAGFFTFMTDGYTSRRALKSVVIHAFAHSTGANVTHLCRIAGLAGTLAF